MVTRPMLGTERAVSLPNRSRIRAMVSLVHKGRDAVCWSLGLQAEGLAPGCRAKFQGEPYSVAAGKGAGKSVAGS